MTTSLEFIDFTTQEGQTRAAALQKEDYVLVDTYAGQLAELAEIRDPESVGKTPAPVHENVGDYVVVYPWRKSLVRIVGEGAYRELRTNRNRDLITKEEQDRFAAARIGFAGLNVGNPGAVCIALEGGARTMKLADLDPLSLTNLNRFRAGLPDLGLNKAILTMQQILEIDPYYNLELHENGIKPDTVESFIGDPKIDLLVEEMDALPLKVIVRETAKRLRVPVIMVTGNGEGVLLDVERYDTEPDLQIMNGIVKENILSAIHNPATRTLPARDRAHLARDFMGAHYLDSRLNESFESYGVTLAGIPQLAESSFMRGAALCYAAKAILMGRPIPSGRYSFSFSDNLKAVA